MENQPKPKLIIMCPVCKEGKEFVRVIEAHEETEPFTMNTPIGSPIRSWVQKTEHPIAYCPTCKIVVFVGPSAEEIQRIFEAKKTAREKRKSERLLGTRI